jgi:hypothetical protein
MEVHMPPELQVLLLSALFNGAVTWGVVSTKLAWLRRDIDALADRLGRLEGRFFNTTTER